jgi:hypothetical protein
MVTHPDRDWKARNAGKNPRICSENDTTKGNAPSTADNAQTRLTALATRIWLGSPMKQTLSDRILYKVSEFSELFFRQSYSCNRANMEQLYDTTEANRSTTNSRDYAS